MNYTELIKFALNNNLGFRCETAKENDQIEVDFVIDHKCEAIDINTLENPTCICVKKYLIIDMPTIHDDSDCVLRDQCISEYNRIAQQLFAIERPQYIMDCDGRFVRHLMWCEWA